MFLSKLIHQVDNEIKQLSFISQVPRSKPDSAARPAMQQPGNDILTKAAHVVGSLHDSCPGRLEQTVCSTSVIAPLSKVNVKKPAEAGLSGGEADQWN
ncbi:hypothetical protein SAMN05216320_102123 [Duganella sp. OV458]|nr:hypothetical protein SAMN05216320_102123 [Duganella sp. OV458]SDJ10255.1 hypothetical protein SAMN05428973_102428 [Duganella sp. OV510]